MAEIIRTEWESISPSNPNKKVYYDDGSVETYKHDMGIPLLKDDTEYTRTDYPDGTYSETVSVKPGNGNYPKSLTVTNRDGTKEVTTYKYDSNSRTANSGTFSTDYYDASGKKITTESTSYSGPCTSSGHFWDDQKTDTVIKTYDDEGNVSSTRTYDAKGNLQSSEVAKEMSFGGKTYTFNAQELRGIVGSLSSSKAQLTGIIDGIGSKCSSMAGTVASEDSGLSGTLNAVSSLCNVIKIKVSNLMETLGDDINSYITSTITNEEGAVSSLGDIDSSLADISSILDGIQ